MQIFFYLLWKPKCNIQYIFFFNLYYFIYISGFLRILCTYRIQRTGMPAEVEFERHFQYNQVLCHASMDRKFQEQEDLYDKARWLSNNAAVNILLYTSALYMSYSTHDIVNAMKKEQIMTYRCSVNRKSPATRDIDVTGWRQLRGIV